MVISSGSVIVCCRLWSVVDRATAGSGVDAGLDLDAVPLDGRGDLAGAQVTHAALAHGQDALVADAHPAPARHEYAGLLGLVEDRSRAVGLDGLAVLGEADRAALADDRGRDAELLGEQLHPALLVVDPESVEQPGRTAGERGA